ncbi:MAG: ATP-binding protein [Firmicutes bacterium]|nr:ATP-binding protein [Bacillota bacterium]
MAKVILLCGKICVGKTTYAKELLRRSRAVYLNTDELMHRFYAGPCGAEYHAALARAQAYLLGVAADIVRAGLDVVYEGAAWLRSDRQAAAAYFWKNGIEAQWHCVAATPETQRAFIEKRNREVLAGESGAAFVDDELFARCEENYEPPEPGEMDVVIQV